MIKKTERELKLEARIKALTADKKQLKADQRVLHGQVRDLSKSKNVSIDEFNGDTHRFGIISDTHVGSLYDNQPLLEAAYDVFSKEGIKKVYHAGDLVDGESMFPGHTYEIRLHGADAQAKEVIKTYPRRKGIHTDFITGSHDLSFYKRAGTDIAERIDENRDDMTYLAPECADIHLKGKGKRKCHIKMIHPGGGTAYALSYRGQKMIESFTGGEKPHILVTGHFHKAEFIPNYRNVAYIQAGCTQDQTPFMMRKNIAAMQGFWIAEIAFNKDGMANMKTQFYPYFKK